MPKSKAFQNFLIFLGFLVLLCLTYWPALSANYIFHDDNVFFLRTETRLDPPGTFALMSRGRHVGAVLFGLMGQLVNFIGDLKILRFLNILQLSACGLLLTFFLRKYTWSTKQAFLISLLLLTLPSFQTPVTQTIAVIPFSVLFSISALAAADRIPLKVTHQKLILNRWTLFSALLFVLALSTYQPGSMFYWGAAGAAILFLEDGTFREIKQKAINLFIPGIAGLVIYAGILQLTKQYFLPYNLFGYNPYVFSSNYFEKIAWFLKEPVFNILNLWNIFPGFLYALLTSGTIVLAAILKVLGKQRRKEPIDLKAILFKSAVFTALVFLSSLPNLITPTEASFYRCYMSLTALVVFLLAWSLKEILSFFGLRRLITTILCIATCAGMAFARQTVWRYRVRPSQLETEFIMNAVRQSNLNEVRRVHIIQPEESCFKVRGDEYGNLTTFYSHDFFGLFAGVFRELAKGKLMVSQILADDRSKEMIMVFRDIKNKDAKYAYPLIIDSGREAKTQKDFQEPTLIIDMRDFCPDERK